MVNTCYYFYIMSYSNPENTQHTILGPNPNTLKQQSLSIYEQVDDREIEYGPIYETEPGHSNKMGISVEPNGCNVAVQAGTADIVDICIYDNEDHNKAIERRRLTKEGGKDGVFCGFVPDMKVGDIYGIRADGEWDPANQKYYNYNNLLIDPYAKAITGSFDAIANKYLSKGDSAPYVPRCVVVDEYFDWGDDKKPNIPKERAIITEGHVKGMTKLRDDIPENQRGTYAGVASEIFIKHLKKVGYTTLELLPVQHFLTETHLQEKGLTNYWGYNTIGFFAPHAEYSSSGQNGEQVNEFKEMVKKLHQAGIEVLLDVVYNHTPEGSEEGPILSFKGLNNDLYHFDENGKHCNYSGCGNTINASSDAGFDLILESLRYWSEDMHVDGFRFDLAPALAREQPYGNVNMDGRLMKAIQKMGEKKNLKIIVEPWDCETFRLGEFNKGWQEWNSRHRDTKRDFLRGEGNLGDYAGSHIDNRGINYLNAHDGFPLMDSVSYDNKHNVLNQENNRDGSNDNRSSNFGFEGPTDNKEVNDARQIAIRSALLSLALSRGTPMVPLGDEMMRSQNGNNNAYCQDNETSWINWKLSKEQGELLEYTAEVFKFRNDHPVFTDDEAVVTWFRSDGHKFEHNDNAWKDRKKVLGMLVSEVALNNYFLYYANGTREDQEIILPINQPYAGEYVFEIKTDGEVLSEDEKIIDTKFVIKALSSALLRRKQKH